MRREGKTPFRRVRQTKQSLEQFVQRLINIVISRGTDRLGPSPAFADVSSIPNICIARLKFDAEDRGRCYARTYGAPPGFRFHPRELTVWLVA